MMHGRGVVASIVVGWLAFGQSACTTAGWEIEWNY
jgi:hypothetical protein